MHRSNRSKSNVAPPYPAHLRGGVPTERFSAADLPLNMQHQYYTFSTPKHMRLQEKMKMNPPSKYAPFMKRGKDVANHKDRPTTRMKGSISQAKRDYDSMPLRQYVNHDRMQPTQRQLTKSRVATEERNITSRGLSNIALGNQRSPRNMLNTAGNGQHVSVTSQQGPAWMNGPVTTNKQIRASGRRC
jgi:hypothetical protein